jgi:hypothetical protein
LTFLAAGVSASIRDLRRIDLVAGMAVRADDFHECSPGDGSRGHGPPSYVVHISVNLPIFLKIVNPYIFSARPWAGGRKNIKIICLFNRLKKGKNLPTHRRTPKKTGICFEIPSGSSER